MKKTEVPQDDARAFEGQKKIVYAVDDEGRLTSTGSSGWNAEEIVLEQAIGHFESLAQDALTRAKAGQTAPLEYHMFAKRMDLTLLAQSTGLFKWRVRRHLRPAVFARLNASLLSRYADALGMTSEQVCRLPDSAAAKSARK